MAGKRERLARLEAEVKAMRRAVRLAQKSFESKMEELNDVRTRLVAKDWFERIHTILELRVTEIEKWQRKIIGAIAFSLVAGAAIGWILNLAFHR